MISLSASINLIFTLNIGYQFIMFSKQSSAILRVAYILIGDAVGYIKVNPVLESSNMWGGTASTAKNSTTKRKYTYLNSFYVRRNIKILFVS